GRDPCRLADAAAAWRLPGDRDARIRRDHPAVRPQRRQPPRLRSHARYVRDQPDRRTRLRSEAARHRWSTGALRRLVSANAGPALLLDRAWDPAGDDLLL